MGDPGPVGQFSKGTMLGCLKLVPYILAWLRRFRLGPSATHAFSFLRGHRAVGTRVGRKHLDEKVDLVRWARGISESFLA